MELIVHRNPEAERARHQPVRSWQPPHRHVEDGRAQAGARPARLRRGLRRRPPRRGEEPRQGAHLQLPLGPAIAGTPRTSGPSCGSSTMPARRSGETIRVFPLSNWTELDIWQYIYAENIPIVPLYLAAPRPTVERDGMILMVDDDRFPLREGEVPVRALGPLPHPRLLSADRRGRERGGDPARRSSRRCCSPPPPSGRAAPSTMTAAASMEKQEAGRLFLMATAASPADAADDIARAEVDAYLERQPAQVAAPLHHLRLGRRRQVDPDRAAALRQQAAVRGPARRARGATAASPAPRARASISPCWSTASRRARAGHHHRRRLPLLRDRQAQVHRRRHARPRAIYPQHGDRRLDRRPRHHPDRRAQGRAHPDPAPQPPRPPARHPPRRAGGQQDGPGRITTGRGSTRSSPTIAPSPTRSASATSPPSRSPALAGDNIAAAQRGHGLV